MKKKILLFLQLTGICIAVSAQHFSSKIDSILSDIAKPEGNAVSVMVLKKGQLEFSKNIGYSDIEKKIPANEFTNFFMGSITNHFTAIAVMMLEEKKKLDYSEKIRDIFPQLPESMNKISIRHLLLQTSGLPRIQLHSIKDNKILLDILSKTDTVLFEAGTELDLNPVNYAILANVIEKKSGKTYGEFIRKDIFKPTMMLNAGITDSKKSKIKEKSKGYLYNNNSYHEDQSNSGFLVGNTGIYCSPSDFQKWIYAFENNQLISQNTINTTSQLNFVRNVFKFYGFGWNVAFNKGLRYDFQTSNENGYTNIVLRIPDEMLTVVIFTNQSGVFGLRKKAFEIVNLYSRNKFKPE